MLDMRGGLLYLTAPTAYSMSRQVKAGDVQIRQADGQLPLPADQAGPAQSDSKYRYRDLQQTTWKEAQWHIIRRSMKGGPATGTTMGHWIVVLESAKRAEKGQGFSCAVRAGPVLGLVLWYGGALSRLSSIVVTIPT
ncbi:hypothetical protein CIB48_g11951 [Xylaria polymorpha]|nr:hypothetical protein CIB48_g11951 [Xylaria polymorpha]